MLKINIIYFIKINVLDNNSIIVCLAINSYIFIHRYSLAFLNIGPVESNTSYVHGCSFNDGFNTALGVYGTDNLSVKNNVIHHGVNELVDVEGVNHTLVNNLVVLSLAEGTYKVS